jgi:tRNA pseudouridine synthase 10
MFNLSKIASYSPFCLSCLGRAFGLIGFGLDNRERGIEILNQLELQVNDQLENKLLCHSSECKICDGLISEISNFIDISSDSISQFSVKTFKIGNVVDKDILERECEFQSIFGEDIGESLKSQLNREIGIGVFNTLKIEALMNNPDLVAIIDTRYDTVNLEVKSLFIEGNYNKFDRAIPQTRWPCSSCKGLGCKKCNDTGQLYPDSVQSLIANPFCIAVEASEDLFHGMGREDIDAAMLGRGRPFVLELRMPKRRELDLIKLAEEVNSLHQDRLKISNLKMVDRSRVAELKNTVCDKTYRVDVSIPPNLSIESLKKGAQRLNSKVIEQRTPTRVSHRRADLVRPRLVNNVEILSFVDGIVELKIRAQHGTYIRELVSGDGGRTIPSLSSLIDAPCKVEVLDVLNLHLQAKEEKND